MTHRVFYGPGAMSVGFEDQLKAACLTTDDTSPVSARALRAPPVWQAGSRPPSSPPPPTPLPAAPPSRPPFSSLALLRLGPEVSGPLSCDSDRRCLAQSWSIFDSEYRSIVWQSSLASFKFRMKSISRLDERHRRRCLSAAAAKAASSS